MKKDILLKTKKMLNNFKDCRKKQKDKLCFLIALLFVLIPASSRKEQEKEMAEDTSSIQLLDYFEEMEDGVFQSVVIAQNAEACSLELKEGFAEPLAYSNLNPIISGLYEEDKMIYEKKVNAVCKREILTKEMLDTLLGYLCNGNVFNITFENKNVALNYLYDNAERTYQEKMLVVMARENLTYEQLDTICAGCVAEGGTDYYEETYRVASTGFNRNHTKSCIRYYGKGLYEQFLAKNQYSVFSGSKPYLKYVGCIDLPGYQGAIDMFYSRVPSVNYLSFRNHTLNVKKPYELFLKNGNKFFYPVPEGEWIEDEYMMQIEEELAAYNEDYTPTLTSKL